jgi:TRAP-type C4-dicarboxylate transport system permease small subunit
MIKMASFLKKLVDKVERYLNELGVWLILVLMVMVVTDVVFRTTTGGSVKGLYELAEVFLVYSVYFAISYTQTVKGHVVVDLLIIRLPEKPRHYLQIVVWTFCFLFSALWCWQSVLEAAFATSIKLGTAGVIDWPVWPAKIAIALGFFLLTLRFGIQAVEEIIGGIPAAVKLAPPEPNH